MKRLSLLVLVIVVTLYAAPALVGQQQPPAVPTNESPVTTVPGTIAPPAPGAPTVPAVVTTTVPSPASPQNPADQVMWALAMSYALRYILKKKWFSFLNEDSIGRTKAFAGFLVAALTAAGIHFAVNGSPFDGQGASVTITGLSFDALKDVGFQWVSQQGWYELIVKPGQKAVT